MKSRILPIVFSAVAIATGIIAGNDTARADVQALSNYTWTYDYTNVYNVYAINYSFSGLDTSFTYRWDMFTVDESTGNLVQRIGHHISIGSATAGPLPFGGAPGVIPWPENYVGPVALRDNLGNILGRHYVAPFPSAVQSPDSGWFLGGGNTAVGDKQVVGRKDFTGECENPAYAPINSDGWQHTFVPCTVATTHGGFTILHYQIDPAYDPLTEDDFINFYLVPTANVQMELRINDLIDFQIFSGTYAGGAQESFSFLTVNTIQTQLPFVDNAWASTKFVSGNDPTRTAFSPGIYNYSRNEDPPSFVSDGESVWIVTEDVNGREWSIEAIDNVGESGTQTLSTVATTFEVWDSYHGFQEVADAVAAFSDTTVYAFSRLRNHSYAVPAIVADDVTVTWTNRAIALNSGLATPTEMQFVVSDTYDILDVRTLEENVNTVLGNIGLDTDSGKAATLTILLFVSMLGVVAFSGLRASIFAYLVVWTGMGSLFVLGGFGSQLVNTVYIVLTIFMWIFAIAAAQSSTDENI